MNNRRRNLVIALGVGAVAAPVAAFAQASPAVRTIGYLSARSSGVETETVAVFRQGLREAGFVEGKNISIESRWADGHYDRLPELAAELVRRQVAVIATSGGVMVARAARAATRTIPIVFTSGSDPVQDGLVDSLNRPGGNLTGVVAFTASLGPKRLELMRELVPGKTVIAFLVNPTSQTADIQTREIQAAAQRMGEKLLVLNAGTISELDQAFATLVKQGARALVMSADLFFQVRREQLLALAVRHRIPTMYEWREFVEAGGLISYSTVRAETWRQHGNYVGRVLNGAKPADLPIVRSTKFELVINSKTAKALALTIPHSLLVSADKVID